MAKQEQLLVHILEKVDKLEEHVGCIRVDQAEIKADLKYHIRRTDLLEGRVDVLQKAINVLLIPVKAVAAVARWLKIIK